MAQKRGESWYDESILDRTGLSTPETGARGLAELTEGLMVAVDVATRTLGWALDTGHRECLPSAMGLFRGVIERADSITSLIPRGQVESIRVLLRSELECLLQLEYMLKEKSDERNLHYRHASVVKRIEWHKRALSDPMAAETKEKRDAIRTQLKQLQAVLLEPHYVGIANAVATKKGNNWYSYDGGPSSIELLAGRLGRTDVYEWGYRYHSAAVHGSEGVQCFKVAPSGANHFMPLRIPLEIQQTVATAITLLLGACTVVADTFFSQPRIEEFRGAIERARCIMNDFHQRKIIEFTLGTGPNEEGYDVDV